MTLNVPTELSTLRKYYFLAETDISIINQKRGTHNKIGFAILLCCMRFPGIAFNAATINNKQIR